jgi:zinc protease
MQRLMKTVLLAVACGLPQAQAQAPEAKVIAPPPTPFVLPACTKTVLPNGLIVLMLEKHEFPIISMSLTLRSGSVADPAGKEGVAVLTAGLLRRGTTSRTAEQIANELDFMGMTFGGAMTFGGGNASGVTLDATTVSAEFLKKDEATALPLAADILLHPSFPADEVSKSLARAQDSARSAKDSPQQVIRAYFAKFLYGSHPYGRPTAGDENSVKSITRDDILAFYKTNYTPGNAILAVAGDFDAHAMKAELEKSFGGWSGQAPALPALTPTKPVLGRRLLFVDKPDATQTYFYMGNVGIDATNPDRGEIGVVNELYGGRFTSLFNTELRIKSGYSYGANSTYSDGRVAGPFVMATYTKNATTVQAMDKTLEVVNTAHAQGFTEEQLASSKNSIAGSLPTSLETSAQLASVLARNELYGITREQFNANLVSAQKTTVADEKRILSTYFPTADNLVIVVVGKGTEIEPLMKKYTTNITDKKISDPGY